MEYKDLEAVNSKLKTMDIKGKAYVQVNTRVIAFRELFPNGRIETEILNCADGVVIMKASVWDGDNLLGTGHAYEKESSSYINKTSYIENCETSAIGRALSAVGIGADSSMCSAEELVNAITNQEREKVNASKLNTADINTVMSIVEEDKLDIDKVLALYKVKTLKDMTFNQFNNFMSNRDKVKESCSLAE